MLARLNKLTKWDCPGCCFCFMSKEGWYFIYLFELSLVGWMKSNLQLPRRENYSIAVLMLFVFHWKKYKKGTNGVGNLKDGMITQLLSQC